MLFALLNDYLKKRIESETNYHTNAAAKVTNSFKSHLHGFNDSVPK